VGKDTKIAWCDHTFNPWWGCQRVSPGCEHCYAESFSKRVGLKVWGPTSDRRFFGDKHWAEPLKWARDAERDGVRRRVFCASMADVLEDRRDLDPWREKLRSLIGATPSLDWLLLTKRPENAALMYEGLRRWPDNVWLGTTTENQEYYDRRWPILARIPARVLFVSHEPALGPLQIKAAEVRGDGYTSLIFPNWIITGGESGSGARPYDIGWARELRRQTRDTPVALFVKQLGARPHDGFLDLMHPLSALDRAWTMPEKWPADLRVRQWPLASEASP
jgi:protein gp37